MVDITRCVRCGKVIPAIDSGCPFCEEPDLGLRERPYIPLAIKLLLILFSVNVMVAMVLSVATLLGSFGGAFADSVLAVLATLRFLLAAASLMAIILKEPWGRTVPLAFIAFEALSAFALALGWLPPERWTGGMLAPLWNVLFLFLFLREDVRARFDPGVLDRKAVGDLLAHVHSTKPNSRGPR